MKCFIFLKAFISMGLFVQRIKAKKCLVRKKKIVTLKLKSKITVSKRKSEKLIRNIFPFV